MNKYETISELVGDFSWNFGKLFYIETSQGNFIWSDPNYDGDNTIKQHNGTIDSFMKENSVPFLRDKGKHVIKIYCGKDVVYNT